MTPEIYARTRIVDRVRRCPRIRAVASNTMVVLSLMQTYTCDQCKNLIADVVYLFGAASPLSNQVWLTGPAHLHWDCIPAYVKKMRADA